MSRIIFNLAAKTDRAGRPSSPNQDNLWVCPDLTNFGASIDNIVGTDEDVELSDKGALLVVADGMGGMNAGEVASKLVIDGIKKKFSNIPKSILTDESEIKQFISNAIIESDESIKQYAKEHKEAEGLGSTIVLLWLLNGKAYCGWCGDSRIYRFNPNNELVRLSHDHSYVQSLVDEGKIPEEDAFDHPDGNIITKALGDNGNKADPELRIYDVYQRDVFLLCSDGLCGLLTDTEINDVIQTTCTSSKDSLKALWDKGQETGWSDNVSIDILCIVDGGKPAKGRPDGYPKITNRPIGKKETNKSNPVVKGKFSIAKFLKPPYLYIIAFVALCLMGIALYKTIVSKPTDQSSNQEFYIPTPNTNNEDASNQESNSQIEQNSQNNSNSGNNNRPNNGRPAGTQPNKPQNNNVNNNHNQNSNNQTNNNANNQSNGGINQGVIEQFNNNQHNNQNSQPQEHYPSSDYLNLLQTVQKDYQTAKTAWATVKKQRYRTSSTDDVIDHYLSNINNNLHSLKDDKNNYNALDKSRKSTIAAFERLAKDLNANYYRNYSLGRNNHGYQNYDDMYDGGRSI